jgi:hypothetical protein
VERHHWFRGSPVWLILGSDSGVVNGPALSWSTQEMEPTGGGDWPAVTSPFCRIRLQPDGYSYNESIKRTINIILPE